MGGCDYFEMCWPASNQSYQDPLQESAMRFTGGGRGAWSGGFTERLLKLVSGPHEWRVRSSHRSYSPSAKSDLIAS
jgi:hypothetical protein